MKKSKIIKLRFTPEELIAELAAHITQGDAWKEESPGFWQNYPNKEAYKAQLDKRYFKKGETKTIYSRYLIRIVKCPNGWMFVRETMSVNYRTLNFGPKHREKIMEGFSAQAYEKKEADTLFISDKGICRIKVSGISRYLSFSTYIIFQNLASIEIMRKMLTIRSNNEWLIEHIQTLGFNNSRKEIANISMAELRQSNSLQEFLTKTNVTGHPISASWFKGVDIDTIVNKMIQSVHMHNPVAYLRDNELLNAADAAFFKDTFTMAVNAGEKFWYNRSKLREKHDEMVLVSLEKDTTIRPISVAPIWREIADKFLTDFELIDDGKRLKKEGLIQRHCVGSYDYNINQGDCAIYSIEEEGNRYTLELRRPGWQRRVTDHPVLIVPLVIYINQFKGFGNCSVPEELMSKLRVIIDAVNNWVEQDKIDIYRKPAYTPKQQEIDNLQLVGNIFEVDEMAF